MSYLKQHMAIHTRETCVSVGKNVMKSISHPLFKGFFPSCICFFATTMEISSKAFLFFSLPFNTLCDVIISTCINKVESRIKVCSSFPHAVAPKKVQILIAIKESKSLISFKSALKSHLQEAATKNWE